MMSLLILARITHCRTVNKRKLFLIGRKRTMNANAGEGVAKGMLRRVHVKKNNEKTRTVLIEQLKLS